MCPKSVHSCYVSSGSTLLVFTSSVSACESIVRFACSRLCTGTTGSKSRAIDEKCLCLVALRMLITQNMFGFDVRPTFPVFHVLLKTCNHITTASNSDPNHFFFLPLFSCCCQLWRQGVCQISGKCHGHLLCTLPLEPLEGQTTAMEPVTWNPTAIRVEGLEAAVQAIANNWMPNMRPQSNCAKELNAQSHSQGQNEKKQNSHPCL